MKLLISLSSYGTKNLTYLDKVIDTFLAYKDYDVTINLHCTVPLQRADINQIQYDNPRNTCLFHRQEFIREQDNYDLFLFAEYDILIQETAINTYLKYDRELPIDYCIGFLRFENTPENIKHLIDIWPHAHGGAYIKSKDIKIGDNTFFNLANPHQACYLLTKQKLKFVIENTDFEYTNQEGFIVESASSTLFSDWEIGPYGVIKKVYPKNKEDLETLLIHHTPDCHVNEPGVTMSPLKFRNITATLDSLVNDLLPQNTI